MRFDVSEYAEALEEFLTNTERLNSNDFPGLQNAMERIIKVLRFARVEVNLYEDIHDEQMKQGKYIVFFDDGIMDKNRFIAMRKTTGDGGVAVYTVYQKQGERDWTDYERNKVHVFMNVLFMVHGRPRAMERVEFLTFHDRDFGSYNITYFLKTTGIYIAQKRIDRFCACFFNFRKLSVINQLVGFPKGTEIMKMFLHGLEAFLSEDEFIFRIGGDNFGMLFYKEKLEQIKNYLTEQDIVYDKESGDRLSVSATAGFFMIPKSVQTPNEIMDKISAAVNVARNVKHEQFIFCDAEIMLQVNDTKAVEARFPEAIKQEEFLVYYQPKVELHRYEPTGAEALCRWMREGQLLPPAQFIPIFEQSNFICILDFYMLEHVCRDIRRWMDEGRRVVTVSVNFSRCHLGDNNLAERIWQIMDNYQVPHEYIEIEFAESTAEADLHALKQLVSALSSRGIRVSMDNFGAGCSSLKVMKKLPWNVIKIDKSILQNPGEKQQNHIMLKHIVALAGELGMTCIAEGVETSEHIRVLKENNCFMAQGFYFDKPLPAAEFEKRLCGQA